MKCCFGTSETPEAVLAALPKNQKHSVVPDLTGQVLFVYGIDVLRKNWPKVRETKLPVIVFDCEEYRKNWSIVDLDLSKARKQIKETNSIRLKRRNPILKLLNKTSKSFVSNFVTLAYKVRDPDEQRVLKDKVFQSLWNGERLQLAKSLPKRAADLRALLTTEDAETLEAALQAIRGGASTPAVARKHKVAAFDLNYVVKYIDRMRSSEQT